MVVIAVIIIIIIIINGFDSPLRPLAAADKMRTSRRTSHIYQWAIICQASSNAQKDISARFWGGDKED